MPNRGQRVRHVDDIWARKAALLEARLDLRDDAAGSGVRIFVPRVEEFSALIEDASRRADCAVVPADEFDCIVADGPLEFRRKTLGLKAGGLVWPVHGRGARRHRRVRPRPRADFAGRQIAPRQEETDMRDIRCPIEGVTYHPEDRARRYFASGAWERRIVGDALRATAARFARNARR